MELPEYFRSVPERLIEGKKLTFFKKLYLSMAKAYQAQSIEGERVEGSLDRAIVYAAVRAPSTYSAARFALQEAKRRFKGEIRSFLDVGAGCASASLAAFSVFPSLEEGILFEREEGMIEVGQAFLNASCYAPRARYFRGDFTKENGFSSDLVVASYFLNELESNRRKEALKSIYQSAKKLIVLIEPGTKKAFERRREDRLFFKSLGAKPISPCPHEEACPLPFEDWCHFVCRVPRSKLQRLIKEGESSFEDEAFFFDVYLKEGEFERCGARVIRRPEKSKAGTKLKICTKEGKIEEKFFFKREGREKSIQKIEWGDEL